MKRYTDIFVLFFIIILFSVPLVRIQANNPGPDENTEAPNADLKIIGDPVISKEVTKGAARGARKNITEPVVKPLTDRGQLLYENHCTACHNDSVHSRNHGKAHSIHDIRQWVIRWSIYLKLDWEKHDIDVVTDFLNERIYHFSTEEQAIENK